MEIFFAVNETYCRQLCVVLVSLAENNRDDCLNIHIVTSGFSETARGRVEKICRHYPNMSVVWHKPDMARFEQLELNISYISRETYFRYVLADLAPELDKALYLDADIVINGSLAPLWNMPLADNYCIGAEDLWIKHTGYKQTVGFGENDLYINAGVLLLNLKKIRKDDLVQRLFENTKKFENKVAYQDQDVINMTFKGHIGAADSIYNFTSANVKYEADKIKRAIVFHYTGGVKPWHEKYKNKAKKYWQKYARLEDKLQGRKIKIGLKLWRDIIVFPICILLGMWMAM